VVGEGASVTIEAAAQWVDVDVSTIREWSAAGALEIEHRGDMEVVSLDHVRILANRRGSMRALLVKAEIAASRGITSLQQLARTRGGAGS
jgi:hypothetical protein